MKENTEREQTAPQEEQAGLTEPPEERAEAAAGEESVPAVDAEAQGSEEEPAESAGEAAEPGEKAEAEDDPDKSGRKRGKKKKSKKSLLWKIPLITLGSLLLAVIIYVAYVFISYYRIPDNTPIDVLGEAERDSVKVGEEYTVMTYNIGFGAYTQDFTFFMDGGKQSWANSKDSVIDCTNGVIDLLSEHKADFACLQEVDFDSTRSYHVNQAQMLRDAMERCCSTLAVNYHSAFLFWPLYQPHGKSNSGLLTLSSAQVTSSLRRSLPISGGLSKLLDLDRCYSINRIPAGNGRELILINVHLSAYGTDGDLQTRQLSMLFGDMQEEYEKGNYVICAGDYNHDFTGSSKALFNESYEEYEDLAWAAPFPDEMIPAHFAKVTDYASGKSAPSCRNCDVPYGPDCFTLIVDGFIVSDNVEPTYVEVIDNEFLYSDHNPVVMRFRLR